MTGLNQPVDQILDNFCHLIIEDFLTRKNMKDTLQTFRNEWSRPSEELVMFSWYELALRLRLPELIEQNCKNDCVLPNLVSALIQESSIRNRRPPEVTVSGLAMQPKPVALPTLAPPPADTQEKVAKPTEQVSRPPPLKINFEQEFKQRKDSQAANNPAPKLVMKNLFKHAPKTSNENWIPEEIRLKSLQRDILHAKETLEDSMKLESSLAREMRRLTVSDLERAKAEESLDATKKMPCGCCTQEFLYVNLPMKVSRKAIIDIRVKWSGQLNSSNAFNFTSYRNLPPRPDSAPALSSSAQHLTSPQSPAASHTSLSPDKSSMVDLGGSTNPSLDMVPQCYDQVSVCLFCAQFFHTPEEYRPSFEKIVYSEKKQAYLARKKKEREYWDPLKMIEEERKRVEEAGGGSIGGGSSVAGDAASNLGGGASWKIT